MLASFSKFMEEGGAIMYVINAVGIIALAIIVERFIFLFFRFNIDGSAFMAQIQKLVLANNIDRAIKLCNTRPNAALPKVIKAGLTRANKGEVEISNAIEEASLEIIPMVTKRTQSLNSIAQLSTYLGLVGTVFGMIEAFAAVANAAPEQKASMLAAAISIAMHATAGGLTVAITCQATHLFLTNMTVKIVQEIDQYSVKLQNLLVSRGKGTTALEG